MSPKTGRPPISDPRQKKVETRMSEKELQKLDYCCKITGKTRSEIIREGVDNVYSKLNEFNEK